MKERIAIIGAGELGRQIAHLAAKNDYRIVGFFDDYCKESAVYGISLLGEVKDVYKMHSSYDSVVIAIGYKHLNIRRNLYDELNEKGIRLATIIDKTANIDPTAKIGAGSIVMANVLIDKEAIVGNNVFIYYGSILAHNSIVHDHSFISVRVSLAGFSTVGECSFLGIATTVIDNVDLCPNVITGGGTVVVDNLIHPGVYVGVPARLLKNKR